MYKFLFFLLSLNLLTNITFAQTEDPERCSTMRVYEESLQNNPKAETLEQFEAWLQQKIKEGYRNPQGKQRAVMTIPYVIHVIHNGEALGTATNIPNAWITAQMDAMNRDFRKANTDLANMPAVFQPMASDFEIEFCPALVDPSGNVLSEPGVNRVNRNTKGWTAPPYSNTTYIDNTIKPNTIWNPDNYLNIWVLNLGSTLLGYATFPTSSTLSGLTSSLGTPTTDGVVITYNAFGDLNSGLTSNYNRGRTTVHEVGHWLGLRHIWGDASCGTDYCNDTPTQQASTSGCPTSAVVTCSNGPNGNMFYNYMDYSYDACLYCFTNDQKTRAVTVMNNSPRRLSLLSSTACSLPGVNVSTASIIPPCTSGSAQTVQVTIKNRGANPIIPGTVSLTLNVSGGATGSYSGIVNSNTLNTNETEILTFTNVNLNSLSSLTLQATAALVGDVNATDDVASTTVNLGAPIATSTAATVCSAATFSMSLSSYNSAATLQWQSSADNITFTNISGATAASVVTSQTAVRYYRCEANCSGTLSYSNVLQIGMSPLNLCYCTTSYTNGCGTTGIDAVTKVIYGTLNNTSACGTGYYTFYNSLAVPKIERTKANSIAITFGSDTRQYAGVWIDHNNDGTFATTEFMANNTSSAGANGTFTGTITIPAGTFYGQTRMRVRGGNDAVLTSAQACATSSSSYGETEDYIIEIVEPCGIPVLANPNTITETSAIVPFTCTNCTGTYVVEYGSVGFIPGTGATASSAGTAQSVTTSNVTLIGLAPGTNYDVYVRQFCTSTGSFSANATKKTFTTLCSAAANLPYSDGFNFVSISPCWSINTLNSGMNIPAITAVTSGSNPGATVPEGSHMLMFNSFTASPAGAIRLESRPLITTGINSVDVSFRMMENNLLITNTDRVTLQYSIDNGITWNDVAYNLRPNPSLSIPTWFSRTYTLPLDAGNQSGLRVGLLFASEQGNNIFFDDFKAFATPAAANSNNNTCTSVSVNNVAGNNTFRFNSGTATYVEINPNGVNLGTVTVSVKENTGGAANVPTVTSSGIRYLPRYFNISATAANPFPQDVSVKLYFHNSELNDFNNATLGTETINSVTVWGYDDPASGTTENCDPNDNTGNSDYMPCSVTPTAEGFVLQFSTNHFTEFGAFSQAGALPVTLADFAAKAMSNSVALSWTTLSERNSKGFEVEKSEDGVHFRTIGFVPSATNSTMRRSYEFKDTYFAQAAYYRLRQIDFDGTDAYSKIIQVTKPLKDWKVSIAPNPFQQQVKMSVESPTDISTTLIVTDMLGKVVVREAYALSRGLQTFNINTETWTSGTYIFQLNNGKEVIIHKIVKE